MNDELNFEHMFGHWSDQSLRTIDNWFSSSYWKQVCDRGDQGCTASLELMQRVSDMLNSLIFHLSNESGDARVQYELKQFDNLLKQFEE